MTITWHFKAKKNTQPNIAFGIGIGQKNQPPILQVQNKKPMTENTNKAKMPDPLLLF